MLSMTSSPAKIEFAKYAQVYDPIKVGSIDATDTEAHDRAILRAMNSTYTTNERVVGEANNTIFVGRLHIKTDEEKLKHKFRKCGQILNCRLIRDLITGTSRSYGFIEFSTRSAARDAVRTMHKTRIHDSEIIVDYECERTMKGWKPRRLGGGFGGKRESGQLRFGGISRPFQLPYDLQDIDMTVKRER